MQRGKGIKNRRKRRPKKIDKISCFLKTSLKQEGIDFKRENKLKKLFFLTICLLFFCFVFIDKQ